MTEQTSYRKKRNEIKRDRVIGAVMIAAGMALTIKGITTGHISMLWPVVGLAGISVFVDSFLTKKTVKIGLNVALIIALAVVYFGVKAFNGNTPEEEATSKTPVTERTDA